MASAQVTRTWNNTAGGTPAWQTPATNWSPSGAPGIGNNANSTNADTAIFANVGPSIVSVGVDFTSSAANGQYALGAIDFNATGGNPSSWSIAGGDSTVSGVLTLNGATVNGVANTILANRGTQGTATLYGNIAIFSTAGATWRLGNSTNVVQLNANRTITVSAFLTQKNAGSGLTLTSSTGATVAGAQFLMNENPSISGVVRIERGVEYRIGSNATLAAGGAASGLGSSSAAAGNLVLDGGILTYAASAAGSTNRLFSLGPGGGTLRAGSSGGLSFTATGNVDFTVSGPRTLTLGRGTGTAPRTGMFAPRLVDNTFGATSLTVDGTNLTWTITNAHTYTGATTIANGATLTLGASASLANSPSIVLSSATSTLNVAGVTSGLNHDGTRFVLKSGQQLQGIGKVTGPMSVEAGATLAPGNSIGTLSTGDVFMTAGSSALSLEFDLGGPLGADLLSVTGGINLGGATLNLSLLNAPLTFASTTFLVVSNDSTDGIIGTFGTIAGLPAGYTASVNYAYSGTDVLSRLGDGNDLAITLTAAAVVPEAGAWLLVGAVAVGAGVVRRFRRA